MYRRFPFQFGMSVTMTRYTRMGRSSSAVSVSWECADVGTSSAHGGCDVRVDTVCPKQYSFSRGVVNWLS